MNADDKKNSDLINKTISKGKVPYNIDVNQLQLSENLKKQFNDAINVNNFTIKDSKKYCELISALFNSGNQLLAIALTSIHGGRETLLNYCLDNFNNKDILYNTLLILRSREDHLLPGKNLGKLYDGAYDFEKKQINPNGLIDLIEFYYNIDINLSNQFYKLYLKEIAPALKPQIIINKNKVARDIEILIMGNYHKTLRNSSESKKNEILNNRKELLNKYLSQYKKPDKFTTIDKILDDALYDDGFVKNLNSLKQAIQIFKEIGNTQAYAICLALFIEAGKSSYPEMYNTKENINSLEIRDAYSELKGLIETNKIDNHEIKGNLSSRNKKLLDYVSLQEESYAAAQEQILNKNLINPTGKPAISNSRHTVNTVTHNNKEYIKKPLENNPIAQLEAFNNELFRVLIGNRQPITKLSRSEESNFSKQDLNILIETIETYKPLGKYTEKEIIALLKDEQIQKDLAEITLSCQLMAENDLHFGNIGTCVINNKLRLVKIDGDQALFPLTAPYLNFTSTKQVKRVKNHDDKKIETLRNKNLGINECFEIHQDDLESSPLLSYELLNTVDSADSAKRHFIPFNWIGNLSQDTELYKELNKLRNSDEYKQKKFEVMLKFILMPEVVYTKIAQHFIHQPELRQRVIREMKSRQEKFKQEALKVPGFQQYLLEHGQSYKNELKTEMINFMEDNKQYFTSSDIDIATKHYDNHNVRYTNKEQRNVTIDKQFMNKVEMLNQRITRSYQETQNQSYEKTNSVTSQIEALAKKLKNPSLISRIIHNSDKMDIKNSVLEKYQKNLLNSVNKKDIQYLKSALTQAIIDTAREKKIKPSEVLDKLYSGVFSHRTSDLLKKQGLFKHDIKPIIKPRDNEIDFQSNNTQPPQKR